MNDFLKMQDVKLPTYQKTNHSKTIATAPICLKDKPMFTTPFGIIPKTMNLSQLI